MLGTYMYGTYQVPELPLKSHEKPGENISMTTLKDVTGNRAKTTVHKHSWGITPNQPISERVPKSKMFGCFPKIFLTHDNILYLMINPANAMLSTWHWVGLKTHHLRSTSTAGDILTWLHIRWNWNNRNFLLQHHPLFDKKYKYFLTIL